MLLRVLCPLCLIASLLGVMSRDAAPVWADEPARLDLALRYRSETAPGSGRFQTLTRTESWDPRQTAVIVCDMWELHDCLNAVRRGAEMAPRMNEVLSALRGRGATIIHAPSNCMEFYADHPARRRAQQIPRVPSLPSEIGQWCYQIPEEEKGEYPLDQSDGGYDDDVEEHRQWIAQLERMGRNTSAPWQRQTPLLDIHEQDFISEDGGEIWSILASRDIDQVILLGVHTNMCVLGRPFGLRNMARYGKNVVLMRDLTDTMYNPQRAPYVSHFTGTDLIVEHIEKWVCPTITSDQILGGDEFRFAHDHRPHVAMIIAEPEYKTEETLPKFAREHLGKEFRVSLIFGAEDGTLPGLDVLDKADVALISIRRRPLPSSELAILRRFVSSGKPVVGIRTASHAFSLRNAEPPAGRAVWESWDQEVFGGNYSNHHGAGPQVQVRLAEGASEHRILRDVETSKLVGHGSLYVVSPLASSATPLLIGELTEKPVEPLAWTHTTQWGGRAFYTSLGHPDDFSQPAFQQLLRGALLWATSP